MNLFQRLSSHMIRETTTSGDIAFVPSQMGVVGPQIRNLLKRKKSWKIKMTEDSVKGEYTMELDGHGIKIHKTNWDAFQNEMKKYGKVERDGEDRYFNVFSNLIAEAAGDETAALSQEVRGAIMQVIDDVPCSNTSKALHFFGQLFPTRYEADNCAIIFNQDAETLDRLMSDIESAYEDDRGAYEMLISALEQKRTLKFNDVINEYKYLFGATASTTYKGVAIRFESFIDMNFVPHEQLTVMGDDELINELDGYEGMKSYGNILYPRSKHIPLNVFNRLKKEIV